MHIPFPAKIQHVFFVLAFIICIPVQAELSEEVVARILQSVVKVDYPNNFGTGFLIDESGLILTSAHVVPNQPGNATIQFANGTERTAEFISFAPGGADLALLRLVDPPENLTVLPLADPADFRIARAVYTVGYPYPVYPALIGSGILGHHRPTHGIIIYDAAVSSGSSGGPVLTQEGKVLGVISSQLMDRAINSVYGGGFNSAIDAPSVHAFLEAVSQGEIETVRTAHLEYLRMPLPQLAPGDRVSGTLSPDSDQLPESLEYANGYQVDMIAGMMYNITMESDDFDTYLLLHDSGAENVAENDDANFETTNSAISYTPDENERFTIVATSFARGEIGEYTLSIQEILFTPEQIIEHTFTADSPKDDDNNKYFHDVVIEGQNRTLVVLMESDELDAYLILYDEQDQIVDRNDDWTMGTTDARIMTRVNPDQRYRLRATTFGGGDTGKFTLTISWGDDGRQQQ